MLYTPHKCNIQSRVKSIWKKKKSSFWNKRDCLPWSGQATETRTGVTSLQGSHLCGMNSPGTREWSALVLTLVRQIFEQVFIGCSSTVWPFRMKPTSPQLRLPVIAYPSLVTENKYALWAWSLKSPLSSISPHGRFFTSCSVFRMPHRQRTACR